MASSVVREEEGAWWDAGPAALGTHQALLYEQAEEHSVAHLPQVLEAHRLQLCILNYVLQLVVEELQDACSGGERMWGWERLDGRSVTVRGRKRPCRQQTLTLPSCPPSRWPCLLFHRLDPVLSSKACQPNPGTACSSVLCRYYFYKLKVSGTPVSSKSIGAIFPIASVHFMSLSDFDNSYNILKFFIIIILVMVIWDL